MNMKEFFKTAGLLLACILLARFIMPANYTPLLAMAVFMPFLTDNKNLQLLLKIRITSKEKNFSFFNPQII